MIDELLDQIRKQWASNPRTGSFQGQDYQGHQVTVHFDSYKEEELIYRISLRLQKDDLQAEQAISVGPFEMVNTEVAAPDFIDLIQTRLERLVEAIEDIR